MDYMQIHKALANPVRIEILTLLKNPAKNFPGQGLPVEMGVAAAQFARFGLAQPTMSAHLAALKDADLVLTRRVGPNVLFRRNEETLARFLAHLGATLGTESDSGGCSTVSE